MVVCCPAGVSASFYASEFSVGKIVHCYYTADASCLRSISGISNSTSTEPPRASAEISLSVVKLHLWAKWLPTRAVLG